MTSEQRQRFEADRETLLDELLARGVPLDCATDEATGRHSSLDKDTKRVLPHDQVSMLIWSALKFFAGPGPELHMISRFLPARGSYDEMPDYLTPTDQHSL